MLLSPGEFFASLSPISGLFIIFILALAVVFNSRYSPRVVELGPTILTTIGIFGTFLGVATGLAHFDTTNVQASVPSLLAGLKTAFWASVFGVGAAVQIKLREFLAGNGTSAEEEEEVSPQKIVEVLSDIRNALAGPGESSLLSQMKLQRQDTNDRLLAQLRMARQEVNERLEAMRTAQEAAAVSIESLRESQTETLKVLATRSASTLVEALQSVVLDFNNKVAAQFGENYRELGTAVRQLLTWQEQYKDTVSAMTGRLDDTVRVLGYAASDLKSVGQAAEQINHTALRLGRTLQEVEANEQRLAEMVANVGKVTEAAAGRVPYIEARLSELVSQMANTVRASQASLNDALKDSAACLRATVDSSQANFADLARAGAASVRDNQAAIATALTENAAAMQRTLAATQRDITAANTEFSRQTLETMRRTQAQMAELDRDISVDLTRAVGKLASQLKTLSAQLADDGVIEEPPKIALVAG